MPKILLTQYMMTVLFDNTYLPDNHQLQLHHLDIDSYAIHTYLTTLAHWVQLPVPILQEIVSDLQTHIGPSTYPHTFHHFIHNYLFHTSLFYILLSSHQMLPPIASSDPFCSGLHLLPPSTSHTMSLPACHSSVEAPGDVQILLTEGDE